MATYHAAHWPLDPSHFSSSAEEEKENTYMYPASILLFGYVIDFVYLCSINGHNVIYCIIYHLNLWCVR